MQRLNLGPGGGTAPQTWWPGRYCTPAHVEIQRAATWIELGRPERAISLFEESPARLPSVHRRDRGVYLARLASAYALSGSPDLSVRKGWEAVSVAQATGVMVGSGTQQADDPRLAVRDAEATRQPLRGRPRSPDPGRRARPHRNTCRLYGLTGRWTHFSRGCPADGASRSASVVALEPSV